MICDVLICVKIEDFRLNMFYAFYALATVLIMFLCGMWIVHLTAIIQAKIKLHRKVENCPDVPYPGISILKPIKGVDTHLASNLESFFTLSYSLYELLFCFEDSDDPAINIVNGLLEKYPNVNAQIITGGSKVGVNPKINNMNPGYLKSQYDFILISDSGIRMKDDTLIDMMNNMKDDVGIVHQMPFACDRDGFSAAVEKIYFGTAHARIYLFADFMQVNCHTGMSTLIRKSLLDDVDGIQSFGCYLAEDYFMAKSIMERGWRTRICSQPALQNAGNYNLYTFQKRLKRWTKLRAAMAPHTIILEPLSECLILGALTSWAVYILFLWDPLIFYLIHVLIWFLFDWTLLRIIQNGALPFNKFYFIIGWLYREICGPIIFFNAIGNSTIKWHSRYFKLNAGGIADEITYKCKV